MPRARATSGDHPEPAAATLFACGYPTLLEHISATVQPHHLISILIPHNSTPWPTVTGIPRRRLEIDDVHWPCTGFRHATAADIQRLVAVLQAWHQERPERLLARRCGWS